MQLSLLSDDGAIVRVKVKGQITQAELASREEPLGECLKGDFSRRVLLDLSEVDFLDSSGVGWLLTHHQRFREQHGMLVIHSIHPHAKKVLKVLKMELVLHLAENEEKARERLAAQQPQA